MTMFRNQLSLVSGTALFAFVSCLSPHDWSRQEKLLHAYYRLNVTNVIRCGRLCERQSRCAAVSYDTSEAVCYMHNAETATTATKRGKFLYSGSVGKMKKLDTQQKCNDTQLYLPAIGSDSRCKNIEYWKYRGCFADVDTDRDLQEMISEKSSNSLNLCMQHCTQIGFKYLGLQYGIECWCGDSYGKHGQSDEDKCDKICPGNPDQTCGGRFVQNIYATGL